jgi:hypothetical protein
MPITPDRTPGPADEEEIVFEDRTTDGDPTEVGALRYTGGSFKAKDSTGVFDLRSGGGGITEAQHKALRQLIHFIDDGPAEGFVSGAYKETLPSGAVFPTSEISWESSSKLKKIVELSTTWTGSKITTEEWEMYDTDGSTVLVTVTDAINYSGAFETDRTRTVV